MSVIVTNYNLEDYLDRCVESLLQQTFTNMEIILVDDGSSDRSPGMCDKWAAKDNRISVIHQTNQGVSAARNTGIIASRGEYIIFIDCDDYMRETHIEALRNMLLNPKVDMAIVGFLKIKRNKVIDETKGLPRVMNREETLAHILKPVGFSGMLWNKMFRRRLIVDSNLWFEKNISQEDLLFNVNYVLHAQGSTVYDPQASYYYMLRTESFSQSFNRKSLTAIAVIDRLEEMLAKSHAGLLGYLEFNKILSAAIFTRALARTKEFNADYYELRKYIVKNLRTVVASEAPFMEKARIIITAGSPSLANKINDFMVLILYKTYKKPKL